MKKNPSFTNVSTCWLNVCEHFYTNTSCSKTGAIINVSSKVQKHLCVHKTLLLTTRQCLAIVSTNYDLRIIDDVRLFTAKQTFQSSNRTNESQTTCQMLPSSDEKRWHFPLFLSFKNLKITHNQSLLNELWNKLSMIIDFR